jgi:hypothetical protein
MVEGHERLLKVAHASALAGCEVELLFGVHRFCVKRVEQDDAFSPGLIDCETADGRTLLFLKDHLHGVLVREQETGTTPPR